jgi:S-adenosylmethionine-diacylglycerol 3-amino-3-carboxypropyl transferase
MLRESEPMRPADPASEVAQRADFSIIRYAQCWEDTDVLLEALAVHPGERCFSVASGGDNTLSLLTCNPAEVVAVDLSPAQLYCVELKATGFRVLEHPVLLELVGVRPSTRRLDHYAKVRPALSAPCREYWDANRAALEAGLASAGKFEHYFALFRRWVLPLIHTRAQIRSLFTPRSLQGRREFYQAIWNNRRWRLLFHLFFSRTVMGHAGRDPAFFKYVEGRVAAPILRRAEHALIELDPARNPYLHWIVLGGFADALPHVWRAENFSAIRENIDRLTLQVASVEAALARADASSIDRFNMSDIFEYVSEPTSESVFDAIARCGRSGGRVAYWNMLAPRRRPPRLAARLRPLDELGERLHAQATTFFYSAFFVDELQ